MTARDPQHWAAPPRFDPRQGQVIREPEQGEDGYWVGAPGAYYDPQENAFYLSYRLRRPRGVAPDRGAETHLLRSRDGLEFETIWSGQKDQLGTTSIERCAIRRLPDGQWALYVSYVDPQDRRWRTDLVTADSPDEFDLGSAQPLLLPGELGLEGVKDPFVFQVAGQYHMVLSIALPREGAEAADAEQMHATNDAYNTGLIRSATGLAVSSDGRRWQWQGQIMGPSDDGWDRYCTRIGTLWRESGVWLALYDGSADVSENYEERVGVAWSADLRTFHRATPHGPLMEVVPGKALRYFDCLAFPSTRYLYYEMAREDGSHDLRVIELPR